MILFFAQDYTRGSHTFARHANLCILFVWSAAALCILFACQNLMHVSPSRHYANISPHLSLVAKLERPFQFRDYVIGPLNYNAKSQGEGKKDREEEEGRRRNG